MKIKTSDIRKIEVFAPGTAGERAIRLETESDVYIFDVDKYPELHFKKPGPSSFEINQLEEGGNATSEISYYKDGEFKTNFIEAESLEQLIPTTISILKENNVPFPKFEDLSVEEDVYGRFIYWDSREYDT